MPSPATFLAGLRDREARFVLYTLSTNTRRSGPSRPVENLAGTCRLWPRVAEVDLIRPVPLAGQTQTFIATGRGWALALLLRRAAAIELHWMRFDG